MKSEEKKKEVAGKMGKTSKEYCEECGSKSHSTHGHKKGSEEKKSKGSLKSYGRNEGETMMGDNDTERNRS